MKLANMPERSRRREAFTLIEMIIVVSIIAILIALLLAAGSEIQKSAKKRSTTATLMVLQAAMQDYTRTHAEPKAVGNWPYSGYSAGSPYDMLQFGGAYTAGGQWVTGANGGQGDTATNIFSDATQWLAALTSDPEIAPKLAALPHGLDVNGNAVILDAWGTPIRYVSSKVTGFSLGRFFLSAGPDRRFSMTEELNPPPPNGDGKVAGIKWARDEIYSVNQTQ